MTVGEQIARLVLLVGRERAHAIVDEVIDALARGLTPEEMTALADAIAAEGVS